MAHRSLRTPVDADTLRNAPYWRQCGSKWACTVCPDARSKEWILSHAIRHHNQKKHHDNVESALATVRELQQLSSAPPAISTLHTAGHVDDPGLDVLRFLSARFEQQAMEIAASEARAPDEDMRDSEDFEHNASAYEGGPSHEQQHLAGLLAETLSHIWGDPDVDGLLSDDEEEEQVETYEESRSDDLDQPSVWNQPPEEEDPWFPYGNAHACSWNVLRYLRRAALSRQQLELARWHAEFNGARGLPTERQMQRIDKQLQDACGISTISYLGAMGNRFSVNSLADMLAQELANPRVRPHLRDLPEDVGNGPRSEAWQFQQWMERIPTDLATPMVRLGGAGNFQDFYVFEPALLHPRAAVPVCMPYRWFTRGGSVFARAARGGGDDIRRRYP